MNDQFISKFTAEEEKAKEYYENIWSDTNRDIQYDQIQGFHYGFYEKGIKGQREAFLNMNDFVGRCLNLDKNRPEEILDVGCGVGGTSLYLAEKYPNVNFTGITIAPIEINIAQNYAKRKSINNANFLLMSYNETNFPCNYFDHVFALESFCHAHDKKVFIHEMHRIIKSGGRLIVIDCFLTGKPLTYLTQKIYKYYKIKRGYPDFLDINTFKSYLQSEGFKNVEVRNLDKNVGPYIMAVFFQRLPSIFYKFLKKLTSNNSKNQKTSGSAIIYSFGTIIPDIFFSVSKIVSYNAIIAEKYVDNNHKE